MVRRQKGQVQNSGQSERILYGLESSGVTFTNNRRSYTGRLYIAGARAYDEVIEHAFSDNDSPHPLDLVRKDLDKLEQTVTWTVQFTDISRLTANPENMPENLAVIRAFGQKLDVSWSVPQGEEYAIDIVDIQGRNAAGVVKGRGTGRSMSRLFGLDKKTGMVFVILRIAHKRTVHKFMIIR